VAHANAGNAQRVLKAAIRAMPSGERTCACASALKYAVMTDKSAIPAETRKKLAIFLDKYNR